MGISQRVWLSIIYAVAVDTGLYKKYGLDIELIFIPSSTTAVSSVVAGDIHLANNSGGAVANAVVGGARLVMTACYINTLPYDGRSRVDQVGRRPQG